MRKLYAMALEGRKPYQPTSQDLALQKDVKKQLNAALKPIDGKVATVQVEESTVEVWFNAKGDQHYLSGAKGDVPGLLKKVQAQVAKLH